jgi:uncharacterized protein YciI
MSSKNAARIAVAFLVAALVTVLSTVAQEAEPRDDPPTNRFYAVVFSKGPAFVEHNGTRGQPGMDEHVKFILGLHADGVVPLAGPLFDDDERQQVSGMLYFVQSGSMQEARELAMREPMVQTEVVEIASVREFLVGVGRLD